MYSFEWLTYKYTTYKQTNYKEFKSILGTKNKYFENIFMKRIL